MTFAKHLGYHGLIDSGSHRGPPDGGTEQDQQDDVAADEGLFLRRTVMRARIVGARFSEIVISRET